MDPDPDPGGSKHMDPQLEMLEKIFCRKLIWCELFKPLEKASSLKVKN
jgi:hypothetical protein